MFAFCNVYAGNHAASPATLTQDTANVGLDLLDTRCGGHYDPAFGPVMDRDEAQADAMWLALRFANGCGTHWERPMWPGLERGWGTLQEIGAYIAEINAQNEGL